MWDEVRPVTCTSLAPSYAHATLQLLLPMAAETLDTASYLSSNPPNPRTQFRLGDWICARGHCAAHNFGCVIMEHLRFLRQVPGDALRRWSRVSRPTASHKSCI